MKSDALFLPVVVLVLAALSGCEHDNYHATAEVSRREWQDDGHTFLVAKMDDGTSQATVDSVGDEGPFVRVFASMKLKNGHLITELHAWSRNDRRWSCVTMKGEKVVKTAAPFPSNDELAQAKALIEKATSPSE